MLPSSVFGPTTTCNSHISYIAVRYFTDEDARGDFSSSQIQIFSSVSASNGTDACKIRAAESAAARGCFSVQEPIS